MEKDEVMKSRQLSDMIGGLGVISFIGQVHSELTNLGS
jgi:hypothetical protein